MRLIDTWAVPGRPVELYCNACGRISGGAVGNDLEKRSHDHESGPDCRWSHPSADTSEHAEIEVVPPIAVYVGICRFPWGEHSQEPSEKWRARRDSNAGPPA